jgi:cytochrome c-type biogenesis protein CcmE
MNKRIAIFGGVLTLVLAATLISRAMMTSMVFYYPVKQVVEEADVQKFQNVRVSGYVKPGTIVRNVDRKEIRFIAMDKEDATMEIAVVHKNLEVPDMFKDHAEVVAEGNLVESGNFESTFIMAKCPSKYETQYKQTGASPHEVGENEYGENEYGESEYAEPDADYSSPEYGEDANENGSAPASDEISL